MREIQHNNAGWDCFRTLALPEIVKTQNQPRAGLLCIFGSHTFVPISWMFKKQTSVSAQLNGSWDYSSWCRFTHGWGSGSRSLGFSDWSISFFSKPIEEIQRNSTGKTCCVTRHQNKHTQNQTKTPIQHDILELSIVDYVLSNAKFFFRCDAPRFLRLTKLWLKWSSKAEVQQWDMYPEPTELLLTGCFLLN